MKITGTFLDEITYDIPSGNWGPEEWAKDFDAMKAVGIDTVILIRVGKGDISAFPSKSLSKHLKPLPVYEDLVDLFLAEAERCGMSFYLGTYDSEQFWKSGQYQKEVDLNKDIIDEIFLKHGHKKAFKGWYLSHEIDTFNETAMKVYEDLTAHLKGLKNLPVLISPYPHGSKQFDEPITIEEHRSQWDKVFARLEGVVDIVAFQDGQIEFHELPEYLEVNSELSSKYNIKCWSNVESFDRDMPIKFPPISWPKMRYKMEAAQNAAVEKLITFEFSHFMSPNSSYIAARNLYKRYKEWIKANNF